MWSSPVELYPVHLSPILAPLGQYMVIEPQVSTSGHYLHDYKPIQPVSKPYLITGDGYTKNLWIC